MVWQIIIKESVNMLVVRKRPPKLE